MHRRRGVFGHVRLVIGRLVLLVADQSRIQTSTYTLSTPCASTTTIIASYPTCTLWPLSLLGDVLMRSRTPACIFLRLRRPEPA